MCGCGVGVGCFRGFGGVLWGFFLIKKRLSEK